MWHQASYDVPGQRQIALIHCRQHSIQFFSVWSSSISEENHDDENTADKDYDLKKGDSHKIEENAVYTKNKGS